MARHSASVFSVISFPPMCCPEGKCVGQNVVPRFDVWNGIDTTDVVECKDAFDVRTGRAEGSAIGIRSVGREGVGKDGALHPMQAAFREEHGLQCGYCTPGMVMMGIDIAKRHKNPSEAVIRQELEGNLCRCTGYHNIVKSIAAGAKAMAG